MERINQGRPRWMYQLFLGFALKSKGRGTFREGRELELTPIDNWRDNPHFEIVGVLSNMFLLWLKLDPVHASVIQRAHDASIQSARKGQRKPIKQSSIGRGGPKLAFVNWRVNNDNVT